MTKLGRRTLNINSPYQQEALRKERQTNSNLPLIQQG